MTTAVVTASRLNGLSPAAELEQGNDGLLYGTTAGSGVFGKGTLFKTTLDGVLTFVSFDGTNGANPGATPLQSTDGSIYGIAISGGSMGAGTVYRMDTNGSLTAIYSFDQTNGSSPSDLIMGGDGNLYGLSSYGGIGFNGSPNSGNGVLFEMTTNGGFTRLADFSETNSFPMSLVEGGDGSFYGTTQQGGDYGFGTVFRMTPGAGLTNLVTFTGTNGSFPRKILQGSDGALYGTTGFGGIGFDGTLSSGNGSVFKVTTNGDLTTLAFLSYTNGAWPYGRIIEVSNGLFYGTTYTGGLNEAGTIFQITTNGQLDDLLSFDYHYGRSSSPVFGLTKGADGNCYGVAANPNDIFCLRPVEAPILQSIVQGGQICMAWHAWGGRGYDLQYKTNLNELQWHYLASLSTQTNGFLSYSDPIGPDSQRFYNVNLGIPEHFW